MPAAGRVDAHLLALVGLPEDVGDLVDVRHELLAHRRVHGLLGLAGLVDRLPEQLVQLRELREVIRCEEIGPQHHQVMLGLFGALLFDRDAARPEDVVVAVVVFLCGLHDREGLDLGLGGVVHTAIEVAVRVGDGGVGEQLAEHGDSSG